MSVCMLIDYMFLVAPRNAHYTPANTGRTTGEKSSLTDY